MNRGVEPDEEGEEVKIPHKHNVFHDPSLKMFGAYWTHEQTWDPVSDGLHIDRINPVLLDPGEFVARWDDCPSCGNYNDADRFGCETCAGKGRVAVPVEEKK